MNANMMWQTAARTYAPDSVVKVIKTVEAVERDMQALRHTVDEWKREVANKVMSEDDSRTVTRAPLVSMRMSEL